jgi:uncharacterized membrane protein (UPF0127 family)
MSHARAYELRTTTGVLVCERCVIAATPWTRLRGLLGRHELPPGEGLLIRPTWSVHMFFMRFAIDAVFLDADHAVVHIAPDLKPWRMASRRGAKAVLEVAAGECARLGISVGDHLELRAPREERERDAA